MITQTIVRRWPHLEVLKCSEHIRFSERKQINSSSISVSDWQTAPYFIAIRRVGGGDGVKYDTFYNTREPMITVIMTITIIIIFDVFTASSKVDVNQQFIRFRTRTAPTARGLQHQHQRWRRTVFSNLLSLLLIITYFLIVDLMITIKKPIHPLVQIEFKKIVIYKINKNYTNVILQINAR